MKCAVAVAVASVMCSCGSRSMMSALGTASDTIHMGYAKYITMVDRGDYTEVQLVNPWKFKQVLHRYLLVDRSSDAIDAVRKHAESYGDDVRTDVLEVPLVRSVVFTSPHCELIRELGALPAIVGVCDRQYINIPAVKNSKTIKDCGSSMKPSVEKIVDAQPQALVISPFENSGGYGELDKTEIPIVEASDYMETSSLGRAEWMKFYGRLYGKARTADSLFAAVDSSYWALKEVVAKEPHGKSVITETKTGNIWYVPGGQSTTGVTLADAGARYIYADDSHNGSLSLAPEQVIDKAIDADVWLFKAFGDIQPTLASLAASYNGYTMLKAYRTGNVYVCNTSKVPYFEEVSFHPERLLREIIQITHPTVDLGGLRYYSKIQ